MDGRTVYSPLYAGVYWEVQDTLMEDVERIEVIVAGRNHLGPNAVNGVINIITREQGYPRRASITGGGNEQRFLNPLWSRKRPRTLLRVLRQSLLTRKSRSFHPGWQDFDDLAMGQGGFRMDWTLKEEGSGDAPSRLPVKGAIEKYFVGDATTPHPPCSAGRPGFGRNVLGRWRHILK